MFIQDSTLAERFLMLMKETSCKRNTKNMWQNFYRIKNK